MLAGVGHVEGKINLENALKYTPSNSPIDIVAKQQDGFVTLDIADRGSGLTSGCEERIFEKFYRGMHVGVPGAGLGLPICKGIAEAHGGSIRAENRHGGGAVFHVTLPIMDNAPSVPLIDGEVEA